MSNTSTIQEYTYGENLTFALLSILSAVSTLSYILSYLVFYSRMKNKALYQILFYFFISTGIGCMGTAVGFPTSDDASCWWESFVSNLFPISACFWALDVTLLLHSVVARNKIMKVTPTHHVICWGVPLIATLLPLTNASY